MGIKRTACVVAAACALCGPPAVAAAKVGLSPGTKRYFDGTFPQLPEGGVDLFFASPPDADGRAFRMSHLDEIVTVSPFPELIPQQA